MKRFRVAAGAPVRGAALATLGPPVLLHGLATLLIWGPLLVASLALLRPPPVQASRRLTNRWRAAIGRLAGLSVPVPYRPQPPRPRPEPDGYFMHEDHLYRTDRVPWLFTRLTDWATDPAARRDLGWMFSYPVVSALGLVPAALIAGGVLAALRGAPLWTALAVPAGFLCAPALAAVPGRWTRWRLGPVPQRTLDRRRTRHRWAHRHGGRLVRLATLGGLALLDLPLLALSLAGIGLGLGLGLVFLLPPALSQLRWLANLRRGLARDWSGVEVAVPYRPIPEPVRRPDGRYRVERHLYKSERAARFSASFAAAWRDPAGWRDLLFMVVDPVAGTLLALLPLLLIGYGGWALTAAGLMALAGLPHGGWYGAVAGHVPAAVPAGIALTALGLWLARPALRWHGRWTGLLLRPTRAARLARRVEQLTQDRTEVADAQAREVRRIERDLHDGAQARLIAVGMTLGALEHLLETDPAAARRLLAQAQQTSAAALGELRALVRGIHPPVLSERGLADAVRALALDCTVPVTVRVELTGRAQPPVESAVYFAVSEALANAVRHSGAGRVEVHLTHRGGLLRATVRDGGAGGADASRGTGLHGIARRLATFDGTLSLHSPPGGPTVVTMELPCALSSPKTSTSSGTA
jgi:signal transduction histidine kinase